MPTWNPDQYLKFADQRTRPCRDLAGRIAVETPTRIIDLGCGPGNSTAVLAERWPAAHITGLDNSPDMIDTAHKAYPRHKWIAGDIAAWADDPGSPFDIVFSNAALQWVGDHKRLLPLIMDRVAPGGALAVQVPSRADMPAHRVMKELSESANWRGLFKTQVREWFVHDTPFYYDVLAPLSERIDFWETEYLHVMESADAIVEWYKGSGLRPFLEALPDDGARNRFLTEYRDQIAAVYPARADGRVLFPFRRIFLIAYRPEPQ